MNKEIMRTPFQVDAVMFSGGRLFILAGANMKTELVARNFLNTFGAISTFLETHPAPFIAKVHRPNPLSGILEGQPGSVSMWLTKGDWEHRYRRRLPGRTGDDATDRGG